MANGGHTFRGREGALPLWPALTRDHGEFASRDPDAWVRQDVQNNLRAILTTTRGRSQGHRDFGVPDLSGFVTEPGVQARLLRELRAVVERWEPRLAPPLLFSRREPTTEPPSGLPAVYLELRARLTDGGERFHCGITVHADGHVEVE